jgi:hypothetical protein
LSALLKQQSRRRSAANGFAFVPHVPLSWAAIVVVEPAVGNPTDARFGKRNNVPMWISFPYRPQFSSASRFTAGAFGFFTFSQRGERPRR